MSSQRQPPPPHSEWQTRHVVLTALVWIYALAILYWFVLRTLFSDSPLWLTVANTFALYLFVPMAVLSCLVLAARKYWLLLPLLVPLILFLFLFGSLLLPPLTRATPSAQTLRVMTFNLNGNSSDPATASRFIAAQNADVVLVQELSPRHAEELVDSLGSLYPYRKLEPIPGRRGIGILSRVPMVSLGGVRLGADDFAGLDAELQWEGRTIRLLNVHLASTLPGENLSESFREQEIQVEQIAQRVTDGVLPTIVGGDLNLTDTSASYSLLTAEMQDAFRESGSGLGLTYPASPQIVRFTVQRALAQLFNARPGDVEWLTRSIHLPPCPLLRIDYILATPELEVVNSYIAPWDGQSDHRAVIAEFQ